MSAGELDSLLARASPPEEVAAARLAGLFLPMTVLHLLYL